MLNSLGANLQQVRTEILSLLGQGTGSGHGGMATGRGAGSKEGTTPVLDQFSRDLTQSALDGHLDPVIGRDKEIERVVQILSRRTKNNPVLVGDPGVGKTAIVEGLAQRIISQSAEILLDKGF